MQREITEKHKIFEQDGKVMCAGWSKSPVFEYNQEQSKTYGKHGKRDCYFISSDEVALYLSAENFGNEFLVKIAVADLKRGGVIGDYTVKKSIFSKIDLPESDSNDELLFTDKHMQFQITNTVDKKIIKCDFIDFSGNKNLYFNIILSELESEGLYELAPFERDRRYFYYKQFMPNFLVQGIIRIGGLEYELKETNSRAYFDVTRFSKPRKHSYQRLSADCTIDGKRFSLNLASRVGDNRYGNENCFIVNGKTAKLSQINVKNTNGRLDRPWYFKGGISAVDIIFKPFTVKGEPMAVHMDKTTIIFGILLGNIKHIDFDNPIVLDNSHAHMILTEF